MVSLEEAGFVRRSVADGGGALAAGQSDSWTRRLAGEKSQGRARADGCSSSATTSIPTWTIRPLYSWLWAGWPIRSQTRLRAAIRRGLAWLLSMQNRDGGWGAFDHENDLEFLNHIPFADHNAMLDPSTADVTARAVECLGQMGWPATHPVMDARAFCDTNKTADGSWFGRWGVNYVYGTSGVLAGARNTGYWQAAGAPAGRRMAAVGAERGRRVRRIDASYYDRRSKEKGKHGFANCLGIDRIAGEGGPQTMQPSSAR